MDKILFLDECTNHFCKPCNLTTWIFFTFCLTVTYDMDALVINITDLTFFKLGCDGLVKKKNYTI